MLILGFDPGASGALAVLSGDGKCIRVLPFDLSVYRDAIEQATWDKDGCFACIEDVHAMPGQGVTSMFSFGRNKGLIEGMLIQADIPYTLVAPAKWKRTFGLIFPKGTDKNTIKNASIAKAKELCKGISLKRTERCKTDSDGMAEAYLIAEHCRRDFLAKNGLLE